MNLTRILESLKPPDVHAVIFDMDGVLCDSEPFIAEAACIMFRETYGLEVTPQEFQPFIGAGEDRFLSGVAESHGHTVTLPRDKTTTYRIYLDIIQGRLQPVPGALAFAHDAKSRGLKIAVATSADRIKMTGNLQEIRLPPESFHACITGDDITRKKPHPEIFLTAATQLGINPANCLVVEDAIHGVQAAKAAGCHCLALTTTFSAERLQKAGADSCAPDLL